MEIVYIFSLVFLLFQVALGNPSLSSPNKGRIVGGQNAPEGRFPFMASIRIQGYHYCGASILNENWLVTAAHCIPALSTTTTTIVVGTTKLNSGGDAYQITKLIAHAGYTDYHKQDDVGLVQVSKSILFNDKVQPISLYNGPLPGKIDVSIIGWGYQNAGGRSPNDLQFVNVKSITVRSCQTSNLNLRVTASQLCTLSKRGEGACNADSGSPVVTTNTKGEDLLAGVVSWGIPCATGFPDVHARVFSYVDWINEHCNNCARMGPSTL